MCMLSPSGVHVESPSVVHVESPNVVHVESLCGVCV